MTVRVYLDWNASAPMRREAREAMSVALDLSGNPSSVHGEGRAARRLIERAREQVAALVGAEARNVIFTSGGTEANALALTPGIESGTDKAPRERLLISAIEHPSVRAGGRFAAHAIEEIPVDAEWGGRTGGARAHARSWRPCARVHHGGEQRDRRDPAGRGGGRDRAPPWRVAACRCRAGGWPHAPRHQRARRGSADAERAQDRRRQGRRRAGEARRERSILPIR